MLFARLCQCAPYLIHVSLVFHTSLSAPTPNSISSLSGFAGLTSVPNTNADKQTYRPRKVRHVATGRIYAMHA